MNLILLKDNTREQAPTNPIITYEIIAHLGTDYTKTIYSTDDFTNCLTIIDDLKIDKVNNNEIDLSKDELKQLIGISIDVVLTSSSLEIIKSCNEVSATAELMTYNVK